MEDILEFKRLVERELEGLGVKPHEIKAMEATQRITEAAISYAAEFSSYLGKQSGRFM